MMRQLLKVSLWSSLLLLLSLGGCSQETGRGVADGPNPHRGTTTAEVGLRFVLMSPASDPVTFTRGTIQTDSESQIEQLDVYQFATVNGEEILEHSYLNQSFTKIGAGASFTLKVKKAGMKKFVFVANNKGTGVVNGIIGLSDGISLADFEKLVTESTDGVLLTTPLLMMGSTPSIEVKEGMPAQKVELMRIMARLDIKNYEPYLTLNRVRLERVSDKGALSPSGIADGSKMINLPEVILPTVVTPMGQDPAVVMEAVAEKVNQQGLISEAAHTHYKHVYYPYASNEVTNVDEAPVLVIEGTLFKGDPEREHKVVYKKVLKIDGEDSFLGFKRNYRYTVAIKGGTIPGEADIKLYVNQWNLVELPMEVVEPIAPRIVYFIDRVEGNRKISMTNFDEGNQQLTIIGNTSDDDYLSRARSVNLFVKRVADWEVLYNDRQVTDYGKLTDWLIVGLWSIGNRVDYHGTHFVTPTFNNAITFQFTAPNTTGKDRSVSIYLVDKVNPSLKTKFTVVQSAKIDRL